jgi:hypothetical protein
LKSADDGDRSTSLAEPSASCQTRGISNGLKGGGYADGRQRRVRVRAG